MKSVEAIDPLTVGFHLSEPCAPLIGVLSDRAAQKGDFQATLVFWSGRPDPDGNISIWLQCDGSLNWGHYCSAKLDAALAKARQVTEPQARLTYYKEAAASISPTAPTSSSNHITWIWGTTARLDGFSPRVDGLIRPQEMTLKP